MQKLTFNICEDYIADIGYGQTDTLTDNDMNLIDQFIEQNMTNAYSHSWGETQDFVICEVSGMLALCRQLTINYREA